MFDQVMDIVDRLFVAMFDGLNKDCEAYLEAVRRQYPFQPLKVKIHTYFDYAVLKLLSNI